jgi:hypothetical protein
MKNRPRILRYLLVAAAWLLLFISLPFHAADLNGFLGRFGTAQTWFFLQWIFGLPRQFITDVDQGNPVRWIDAAWMLILLLGLLLLVAAPLLVYRVRSKTGRIVIRCCAPTMLLLPATLILPPEDHFPIPGPGLWLLAAAHLLAFSALFLATGRTSAGATT